MGTVWAAEPVEGGNLVALKLVRDVGARGLSRRLLREARAACAVSHPNVVRVDDVLTLDDGSPVLVLEFLVGESLGDRLQRDPELPLAETCRILAPVVSAVGTAHALGVVHRDLKPQNVFLSRDGEASCVKVLDFGLAKLVGSGGAVLDSEGQTTGALLGTPCYMSPEQVFGERDVDHRTDIWSLGVIVYQCLSGILPTSAKNVGQVLKIILTRPIWPLADAAPDLPSEVTAMVDLMLSRSRDARPGLDEVLAMLQRHGGPPVPRFGPPRKVAADRSADESGSAAAATAAAPPRRAPSRVPLVVGAAAATVIGVAVAAAAYPMSGGGHAMAQLGLADAAHAAAGACTIDAPSEPTASAPEEPADARPPAPAEAPRGGEHRDAPARATATAVVKPRASATASAGAGAGAPMDIADKAFDQRR
jgi:hypothetical protein